jgi:hypothetical protein
MKDCKFEKERGKKIKTEMEGTCPYEKLVTTYKTTRCHNPKEYNLNEYRNKDVINAHCVSSLQTPRSLYQCQTLGVSSWYMLTPSVSSAAATLEITQLIAEV